MDWHMVERALGNFETVFGPDSSPCLHKDGKRVTPKECLANTPVGSLLFRKSHLIEINAKDNLDTVLRRFEAFNLKCAPVYDANKLEYVGIISTFDIMVFVAFGFFKNDDNEVTKDLLAERRAHVAEMPIESLIGSADYLHSGWWQRNGLYVYEPTTPLESIISPMMSGVGRLLVRTETTKKASGMDAGTMHEHRDVEHKLLSETDLLTFMCQQSSVFAATFKQKLSELGLDKPDDSRKLVTVNTGQSALHAYRRMFQENAEAAGVVDCHGKLLAVMTASDLRGVRLHNMEDLLLPVRDFLAKRRFGTVPPPFVVGAETTLLGASAVMIMGGVHHVWVVDAKGVPATIVRMADVLHALWKDA